MVLRAIFLVCLMSPVICADRPIDEGVKENIEYKVYNRDVSNSKIVNLYNRSEKDVKVVLEIEGDGLGQASLLTIFIERKSIWKMVIQN